jgi:hypothetical protein
MNIFWIIVFFLLEVINLKKNPESMTTSLLISAIRKWNIYLVFRDYINHNYKPRNGEHLIIMVCVEGVFNSIKTNELSVHRLRYNRVSSHMIESFIVFTEIHIQISQKIFLAYVLQLFKLATKINLLIPYAKGTLLH